MLAKLIHILSLMAFAAVNYNAEPKWKSFAFFIDVWYSQIWKMAKRNGSRNNINIHSGFLSLANVRLCCVQAFECYMQRLGRLNVVYAAILCLQTECWFRKWTIFTRVALPLKKMKVESCLASLLSPYPSPWPPCKKMTVAAVVTVHLADVRKGWLEERLISYQARFSFFSWPCLFWATKQPYNH